jgi:hypothetical protein
MPIQVGPGRFTVEEAYHWRRRRAFVDVVHAKRCAASVNVDVVRVKRITWQPDEPVVGST